MVPVEGFDVQDASVAAGAGEVAVAEGAEEFGEVVEGVLVHILRQLLWFARAIEGGRGGVRIISVKLAVCWRLCFFCRGLLVFRRDVGLLLLCARLCGWIRVL